MKSTLKSLALVGAGGALGFVMLVAAAVATGAQPWQGPDVVIAAGPTQTAPMASGMHAEEMPEGMMKGAMAMGDGAMCEGMMAEHQETAKLIDQLTASFTAIETEKDAAALKNKLAQHGVLLKQLQTKSQESMRAMGSMMDKMHDHMMTCPMMKGEMTNGGTMSDKTKK